MLHAVLGESKKVAPLKLVGIFSLRLSLLCQIFQICWQFTSTIFVIYLNILSNGVNFSTSTHCFYPVKF